MAALYSLIIQIKGTDNPLYILLKSITIKPLPF